MTFDFPKKGVGLPVSYLDVFISRSSWYSDQQYYVGICYVLSALNMGPGGGGGTCCLILVKGG